MAGKLEDKIKIETHGSLFNKGDETGEKVVSLPPSSMHRFEGHTFQMTIVDEAFQDTINSVAQHGVIEPTIVRPRNAGGYEIIAGHRRHRACELAERDCPAIVRDIDDDDAIIFMVESNKSRTDWLPSERGLSYKAMLDALKRKAGRPKENYSQNANNLEYPTSIEEMEAKIGKKKDYIYRYIRLTNLIPPLLELVDRGKLRIIPAGYVSYLNEIEQNDVLEAINHDFVPYDNEAKILKEVSEKEGLDPDKILEILSGGNREHEHYEIPLGSVKKYIPKGYSPQKFKELIVKLLKDHWEKSQQAKSDSTPER